MGLRSIGYATLALVSLTQCRASPATSTNQSPGASSSASSAPSPAPAQSSGPTLTFLAVDGNAFGPSGVPSVDDAVSRLSSYFGVRYGADELYAVMDSLLIQSPNSMTSLIPPPTQGGNGQLLYAVSLHDIEGGILTFNVDDEVPQDGTGYDADARDASWPVPMDPNYNIGFAVDDVNLSVIKWPIALEKAAAHALHVCDGSGYGSEQQDCDNSFDGLAVADFITVLTGAQSTETPGAAISMATLADVGTSRVGIVTFPPQIVSMVYPDGSKVVDQQWQSTGFGVWITDPNQSYGILPTSYAVTAVDPNGTLTLRAPHGFGIVPHQTVFDYCSTPSCSEVLGAGSPTFTLPLLWVQRLADHLTTAPLPQ